MTPAAWLTTLLRTAVEGGLLLLLIWAVTRLWPRMPAGARCMLWWLGALRLIAGLVPLPSFEIVWRPEWVAVPAALPTAIELGNAAAAVQPPATVPPARNPLDGIAWAIAALWAAGVTGGAWIMARRLLAMRRAWREAGTFDDPRVARWREEWAIVLGSGRVPEVRASAGTTVPVAIGAFRPGLLVPADSQRLSDDALRMVFAHEMSHVRRGDPLLGWVPAVAQLLFWFHPLARFAAREYLAAREQVCDAEALRATGLSPRDYGALLLDYGVGRLSDVPGAASCGSRGSRELKRRLDMLSRITRVTPARRLGALAVTLIVAALAFAPIRFVAAHDDLSGATKRALEKKIAAGERRSIDHIGHHTTEKTSFAYMIKREGRRGTRGSVSMEDMESARALDRRDETAVYFRIGDQRWITHDPQVLTEITEALGPEDRFEDRQKVRQGQFDAYEKERAKIEAHREEMEAVRRKIEMQRDKLMAEQERRRDQGRASDDDLRAQEAALEQEMEALRAAEEEVHRSHELLHRKMTTRWTSDKALYAEMNRVHEQAMREILRIARRAIDEGRADPFEP